VNNPVGTNQLPASVNQPFTSFPTDYSQLPTVSIVIPNELDNMHGVNGGQTGNALITTADTWLQNNLGGYAQWAKTNNSLLIVTWDENDSNPAVPNQIPTIFYGANVQTGSYPENINHFSVLRTIEAMYGLPLCSTAISPNANPANDTAATPITDIWNASYNWRTVSETVGADGNTRLLWTNTSGAAAVWDVNASTGALLSNSGYGPYAGWTALRIASAGDGSQRLLWQGPGRQASIWTLDASGNATGSYFSGVIPGWRPIDISVGTDGNTRLLWQNDDGTADLWNVNTSTNSVVTTASYAVYNGWLATHVVAGADGVTRLLWNNAGGAAAVWLLNAAGGYTGPNNTLISMTTAAYAGWTVTDITVTSDGLTHLLWTYLDGRLQVWNMNVSTNQLLPPDPIIGPFAGWTGKHLAAASTGVQLLWDYVGGAESLWSLDANGNVQANVGFGPI
jgi:hypothetical protein